MEETRSSIKEGDAQQLPIGIPLQTTEDHLGRILGRETTDLLDSADITWKQERDHAVDDDDEALLAESEVDNAEDDAIDADNDDATLSNLVEPGVGFDGTRLSDLIGNDTEGPRREGHVVSPEDAK